MVIYKGDVIINGEEMVLFSTISDYEYPDLEIAIHVITKEEWDKLMQEENADGYFYKTNLFKTTYEEQMEYWKE